MSLNDILNEAENYVNKTLEEGWAAAGSEAAGPRPYP